MPNIFIEKTGVLDRLGNSLDRLMRIGFTEIENDRDLINRLLSMRNQINLGSTATRSASLAIISICRGNILLTALRKIKSKLQ